MKRFIFVLFTIFAAVCAFTFQTEGGCQASCPRTIPADMSSRGGPVTKPGSCSGRCKGQTTCTGATVCIYNPRSGDLQGVDSSRCKCGSNATPTPSQAIRALSMDLEQKKDIRDDVWDKRYLEDAMHGKVPLVN